MASPHSQIPFSQALRRKISFSQQGYHCNTNTASLVSVATEDRQDKRPASRVQNPN